MSTMPPISSSRSAPVTVTQLAGRLHLLQPGAQVLLGRIAQALVGTRRDGVQHVALLRVTRGFMLTRASRSQARPFQK